MIEAKLTSAVIGAAIDVHKHWGPGLYEQIYERSLCRELGLRKIAFQNQLKVALKYKGEKIGEDLRVDLFVEERLLVEAKAVGNILPIHESQVLTYMRLLKCRVGLLINFNVPVLRQGIRRFVL